MLQETRNRLTRKTVRLTGEPTGGFSSGRPPLDERVAVRGVVPGSVDARNASSNLQYIIVPETVPGSNPPRPNDTAIGISVYPGIEVEVVG